MDALTAVVIDDEPPARERLALMLAEAGVEVVASLPDAYAALDWFGAGHHCDAAFVDIQMPQMNGIQLAARLARLPHPPAVVFTTAHEEHALAAFDVNAADYLLKPVRRDRLAITLGKLPVHAPAQTPVIAANPATPRHAISASPNAAASSSSRSKPRSTLKPNSSTSPSRPVTANTCSTPR